MSDLPPTRPHPDEHLDDEVLSSILDDELDDASALDHLDGCDRCEGRLDALRNATALVAFPPPPPDDLLARRQVAAAIAAAQATNRPKPSDRRSWQLGAAAALLVLGAAGGALLGRHAGHDHLDSAAKSAASNESATDATDATDATASVASSGGGIAAPAAEPVDDPVVLAGRVRMLEPRDEPAPACEDSARAATGATGKLLGTFVGTRGGEPVLVLVLQEGAARRALVTGAGCSVRQDVVVPPA
jgi:hypothetical protein